MKGLGEKMWLDLSESDRNRLGDQGIFDSKLY